MYASKRVSCLWFFPSASASHTSSNPLRSLVKAKVLPSGERRGIPFPAEERTRGTAGPDTVWETGSIGSAQM